MSLLDNILRWYYIF